MVAPRIRPACLRNVRGAMPMSRSRAGRQQPCSSPNQVLGSPLRWRAARAGARRKAISLGRLRGAPLPICCAICCARDVVKTRCL
eukprot:1621126-Alexandrium_andersonii.AAC.1